MSMDWSNKWVIHVLFFFFFLISINRMKTLGALFHNMWGYLTSWMNANTQWVISQHGIHNELAYVTENFVHEEDECIYRSLFFFVFFSKETTILLENKTMSG